jgi:hypothetical protein
LPFKGNREIKTKKKEVTEKALTKNYIDPYKKCGTIRAGRTDKRWSTKDLVFRSKYRFGENFPKGKVTLADREQLFSSFTENGVFPVSS